MAEMLKLRRNEDKRRQEIRNSENKSRPFTVDEDQTLHDYFAFRITRAELFQRRSQRNWDGINRRGRRLGYSFAKRRETIEWKLLQEWMMEDLYCAPFVGHKNGLS